MNVATGTGQGGDSKHLKTIAGKTSKVFLQLILNLAFQIVSGFLQMQLRVPELL